MQWSGTRMVIQHIDPWHDSLAGDPAHMVVKTQIPNYLPLLYILMVPLGAMPLPVAEITWGLCNLAFACVSAWLAARFFGAGRNVAFAVTLHSRRR